jgi:hypothetical protein
VTVMRSLMGFDIAAVVIYAALSREVEVMIASKESNLMTYQGLQVRADEMGITRRWAAWEKCSAEGHYFGTTATNPPLRYCQRCFTAWSWRSESDPPLNEPIRPTSNAAISG